MTKQREKLMTLTDEIQKRQTEIQNMTTHPNGKSYGKCIRELIYRYIDPDCIDLKTYRMHPAVHMKYEKLHGEISRVTGNKSQMYTEDEYMIALHHMQTVWKYDIPEDYVIKS